MNYDVHEQQTPFNWNDPKRWEGEQAPANSDVVVFKDGPPIEYEEDFHKKYPLRPWQDFFVKDE